MSRKTFSIIIATYNCGRKIELTVESILAQDRNLFELIVVDGASTDGTLKYLEKYADDLTLVSEKDSGVYYAYNKGIELATGEYLYFIGAGDRLYGGVLARVKKLLPPSSEDALDFVYGDVFVKDGRYCQFGKRDDLSIVFENIYHQSIFYSRRIFDVIGKYDLKYKIYADWALNWKCLGDRRVKPHYIECVVAEFEGGGLSSTTADARFEQDAPQLIKNCFGARAHLYSLKKITLRNAYWKLYFPFVRPFIKIFRREKDARISQIKR